IRSKCDNEFVATLIVKESRGIASHAIAANFRITPKPKTALSLAAPWLRGFEAPLRKQSKVSLHHEECSANRSGS
ncbi:MAG TPA: hypothetical protein VJQ54_09455, partial [Candidatus Sulfotelmatobacter sp.]|nr:hypothetical protein [Candidatus Sulfotelmatobacter sp.]